MKHNAKKILSLLLSFVLVLSLLPGMTAFAADSGNCGDNVTWNYDNTTNTLTISGSGAMANNAYMIWHDNEFQNSIKTVVIENGVTSIGTAAFVNCASLTSITIPDSVTSIGMVAFYDCESLTSITIPDSVTSIGSSAFVDCVSLTSITIPNSVTSIGEGVFTGCDSLSSVTIPNSVTSIGMAAFADCASLTSITIPNSVTSIGGYAFYDCSSLTSVTFEPGTTGAQLKFDHDAFESVSLLAYGAGSARLYDGDTEIKAGTALNTLNDKTLTWNSTGYTVTYQPGDGASLKEGIQPPDGYKVDGQNIVKTGVKGEYKIEGLDSCFNAPEGKVFDCWKDANGTEYREGQKVDNVTANLTLTAQWKEEKKPDGGEKKTSGGGSGFDLVFNIPGEDNSWGYGGGYAPQQAYRVSLAPMQGGSAALGLTTGESTETAMNVYPTTTVYVFPNAEQGYELDKIVWSLIDGSASYDITEAKNFVMPAMDAVVYVTFKPVG